MAIEQKIYRYRRKNVNRRITVKYSKFDFLYKFYLFLIKIILNFHKKIFPILIGYLVCYMLMIAFVIIDVSQIKEMNKPIFSVPTVHLKDGGSIKYVGFGYSVWNFNSISQEKVNNKEIFGVYKGYQVNFLLIPLKDHSYFVPEKYIHLSLNPIKHAY